MYDKIMEKPIPQTKRSNKREVKNNAGGFVYKINKWKRFNRFLIIGSGSGTYYVSAFDHTSDNVEIIKKCLNDDYKRTVDVIVEVSTKALAAKQEPTMYALAIAMSHDDVKCRRYAASKIQAICRIPTHLFMLVKYIRSMRSIGRLVKRALQNWYLEFEPNDLAYQMVKYKNREGYTHRDVLRLIKPIPKIDEHDHLFGYATGKLVYEDGAFFDLGRDHERVFINSDINIIEAVEKAKALPATRHKDIIALIKEDGLTREMIPTWFLNEPKVWKALLVKMPFTAMIRNLGKMSSIGLLKEFSDEAGYVVKRLKEGNRYIHPIQVLSALKVYSQGHGDKGSLSWTPCQNIHAALNDAFYASFENVKPTGKKIMMNLDVSGSMTWNSLPGLTLNSMEVATAMSLMTSQVEDNCATFAFCGNLTPFNIKGLRIDGAMRKLQSLNFGRTDCSLPMQYALQNKLNVDVFIIYTDNETWSGRIKPIDALKAYRKAINPEAKLIICATTSTQFSIADPKDQGMMDICGFASNTPKVMSEFISGNI